MKHTLTRWTSLIAAAAVVSACADQKEPVAPSGQVQTSMSAEAQSRLPQWFAQASPVVLSLPGTVFADNDEANNRLLFGVQNANAIVGVRTALEHLGIPASAYAIQVTEPIEFKTTLQNEVRPVVAGLQIHFGNYLCTLGFNADDGGQRSMYTASHCTNKQGGVESTQYYQPLSSVNSTVIATEVEDPIYRRLAGCAKGRKCRYSDASRAAYSGGVTSTRGVIEATSGPNNGSLTIVSPSFTVTSQDDANSSLSGTVNKVGRTTGWTQGNITQTCADINVSGSNIELLCQTLVERSGGGTIVGAGDSGSGVFKITSNNNVQLVGILWGGNSSNTLYVFSPLQGIVREMDALNAIH